MGRLWKKTKENPYLPSYLALATICCLAMSILFFYIHYTNEKESRFKECQAKAQMVLDDFELQMELFEKISVQVMISNIYRPSYFRGNKYTEMVLVNDFEQYAHYSGLTDDIFLYYGGDSIFHARGNTIDLDIYLDNFGEKEQEELPAALAEDKQETRMYSYEENAFLLIPLRFFDRYERKYAVLGFAISHSDFQKRIQVVSGGMEGNIAIYWNGQILYHNREEIAAADQKNVISLSANNGEYTICYLPDKSEYMFNGYLPLQILLVLADVMLVLIIAHYFARRSYTPILELTDRYRKKVDLAGEETPLSSLDEIDRMMECMLQNNLVLSGQIREKQEILHRQVLQQLLSGNDIQRIQPYLDRSLMKLPGPYYFVISLSFEKDAELPEGFLKVLQEKLEGLSDENEKEFVYTISYQEKSSLSAICSIREMSQKDELAEYVCGVAESYGFEPMVGIGNVYQKMSRISASWLESMDELNHSHQAADVKLEKKQPEISGDPEVLGGNQGNLYSSEDLYRITAALQEGNESAVMSGFASYIREMESTPKSMLVQQYVFAEFLSEVARVGKKFRIEVPKRSISLIVTAKNLENFQEAARDLLQDMCDRIRKQQNQAMENEEMRICAYVEQHFTEYDLSIEKVAADLNTSVTAVRQAILSRTGRLYKDYLIFLRIEYAKTLLLQEDMTVDEVCQKVGYSSISYFTKLFRETTGVTPAKYRTK